MRSHARHHAHVGRVRKQVNVRAMVLNSHHPISVRVIRGQRKHRVIPHSDFYEQLSRFMADSLGLSQEELPRPGPWSRSGLTIGALSLRLSVLDLDQIDRIIDRQELTPKLFGELAIELGFATRDTVERLLLLQKFHWALEFGELLVLARKVELPRMVQLVGRFLETCDLQAE